MQRSVLAASMLLILYSLEVEKRRKERRRYRRCTKCNPNPVLRPPHSGSESSSEGTDGSSTDGECDCESNDSSLYTDDEASEESQDDEQSTPAAEQAAQKVNNSPAVQRPKAAPRLPLQDKQNVIVRNTVQTQETMRRYPAPPQDIPFKYSVRDVNTGVSAVQHAMCAPPVGPGESYSRHMAEIEYWVKTHRPPCTYGMPCPPSQINAGVATSQQSPVTPKVDDTKQADVGIKRPIDPDASPEKNAKKKLVTTTSEDAESPKPQKKKFFTTTKDPSRRSLNKTNGSCAPSASIEIKKPVGANSKNANGDASSESTKKSRGRPTSTPIISRTVNVNTGKKASSVANKAPPRTRNNSKATPVKKEATDIAESPNAGPSHSAVGNSLSRDVKPGIVDDSDTSVLTAPYIRSTRNSASKSKCQTLTRQRASQGKANKFFATSSLTKCDDTDKTNPLDVSLDTKESSAADVSKITSDSSLDIFGPDLTKESTKSRKSTLRGSSVKKLPTLHFSGTKIPAPVKRRSEPIVTRMSAKRALLSSSCQLGTSIEMNEDKNGFSKQFVSEPSVSRTDVNNKSSVTVDNDVEANGRRKFFS